MSKILIVEDEKEWFNIICERIEEGNIEVSCDYAQDASEAFSMMDSHQYKIIITDGLEGGCFPILRKTRLAATGHPEYILFTGDTKIYEKIKSSNATGFMKPDELDNLVNYVSSLLKK